MYQKNPNSPFLYDDVTGRLCGIKQADGTEDLLTLITPTIGPPVNGVQATLTTDMTNANADITLTAVNYGANGDLISVTYIDPSALDQSLYVLVNGFNILVYLATDGSGTITSTAAQVIAAINAHAAASALVVATDEGDGSGVVNAATIEYLAGGVTCTPGVVGSSLKIDSSEAVYLKTGEQVWELIYAGGATGPAASLKSPDTTGVTQVTGPGAGTTRVKTVRDANDTLLELGGSYTPSGTWNWGSASVTWPTFNQSTTGNAATATTANEVKSPDTTGVSQITGPGAGTTRVKTVRDANDTLLELGGSYAPTGAWSFSKDTTTPTKHYYVDGSRADTYTADGGVSRPYLTVLAALTAIQADYTAAADKQTTTYVIHVAPGTYTDNLTINTVKHLRIEGIGVVISGTIAIDQSPIGGSGQQPYTRIEFIGSEGIRAEKGSGLTLSGAITGTRTDDSLTYISFRGCWISGNQLYDTDGTWVTQYEGCRVAGTIDTGTFSDADSTVLIEAVGWNEFAGAITDKVTLYNVTGAEFWGAITTTPIFDCRLIDCQFHAAVSFTAAVNIVMNAVSVKSAVAAGLTLAGSAALVYPEQVANGTYKGIIDIAAPGDLGTTIPGKGIFSTLRLKAPTELTIDTDGAITVTQSCHTVDTFEDAATDDLVTITGGVASDILVLMAANDGRTVVVKDGGTLYLAGDCTLDSDKDTLTLLCIAANTWVELARSGNA